MGTVKQKMFKQEMFKHSLLLKDHCIFLKKLEQQVQDLSLTFLWNEKNADFLKELEMKLNFINVDQSEAMKDFKRFLKENNFLDDVSS